MGSTLIGFNLVELTLMGINLIGMQVIELNMYYTMMKHSFT